MVFYTSIFFIFYYSTIRNILYVYEAIKIHPIFFLIFNFLLFTITVTLNLYLRSASGSQT